MAAPTLTQPTATVQAISWLKQLIESALNWFFSLTHSAARSRDAIRWVFFLSLWGYWVATLYDLEGWKNQLLPLQDAFFRADGQALIIQMGVLFFTTLFHATVLRHLLALVAPYMLIHRFAAVYLADIFEKDVDVATRFIDQAAFGEDYLTIRVREGKLVDSDQGSPVVQIGGPGYVTVELDSAVVFERPDGSLHIIGPTTGKTKGREVVDDFERLRQCIDLRDINDKQDISSRSRDGIPISARDIQYSYSIYRGENPKKTLQTPYPFDEKAVEKMVYGTVRPMAPGRVPDKSPEWMKPLPGKLFVNISSEFGSFIGRRGLSEFFSSIGSPEEEALRQRQETLLKDGQELAGQNGPKPGDSPLKAGPFTARPSLTESIFGVGFREFITKNKGLQANWIGVGIWETPSEIIPSNHLKAWTLSQENRKLGNPENIQRLKDDIRSTKLINLIDEMPLALYFKLYNEIEKQQKTEEEAISLLFEEYLKRLNSVVKYYEDHQNKKPENIATALESVNQLLYHVIGNDYYICIKNDSKSDNNIQGALAYTISVAFSARPLPGYTPYPVQFDFGNSAELDFVFQVSALNASVEPALPQKRSMKRDELYIVVEFQVVLLPVTETDAIIDVSQARRKLAHLYLPLNA